MIIFGVLTYLTFGDLTCFGFLAVSAFYELSFGELSSHQVGIKNSRQISYLSFERVITTIASLPSVP